jgi:prepilin-type processing-associated H-X9-DG protein
VQAGVMEGAANFHEPYHEETTANVAFADGHVA